MPPKKRKHDDRDSSPADAPKTKKQALGPSITRNFNAAGAGAGNSDVFATSPKKDEKEGVPIEKALDKAEIADPRLFNLPSVPTADPRTDWAHVEEFFRQRPSGQKTRVSSPSSSDSETGSESTEQPDADDTARPARAGAFFSGITIYDKTVSFLMSLGKKSGTNDSTFKETIELFNTILEQSEEHEVDSSYVDELIKKTEGLDPFGGFSSAHPPEQAEQDTRHRFSYTPKGLAVQLQRSIGKDNDLTLGGRFAMCYILSHKANKASVQYYLSKIICKGCWKKEEKLAWFWTLIQKHKGLDPEKGGVILMGGIEECFVAMMDGTPTG